MRSIDSSSRSEDLHRRRWLQGVSAGVLGCGLPHLLALQANVRAGRAAARNVLVIYEEGGISQMDTWDPKPFAPVDHRSPYEPIATSVPGIHYTSLMPEIAKHADKLGIATERRVRMPDGRQVEFSEGGRPIHELF